MKTLFSNATPFRHFSGIRRHLCVGALALSSAISANAADVSLIVDVVASGQKRAASADTLHVIRVPESLVESTISTLKSNANIAHVEVDQRVMPASFNDPLVSEQWALTEPDVNPAGTSAVDAWQQSLAQTRITVAIVDTGVLMTHEDFDDMLPGYDFVSDIDTANDGDGRDSDPSDPGDWVSAQDISTGVVESSCSIQSSTWHGTGVTGVLAAKRNNGTGIAGAATHIDVLPIRVMGKCGGYVSDLIAGIRWAAGLDVSGAPDNQNPAQVINLSLGIASACTPLIQGAINDAIQAGAVVVAAAGNHAADMSIAPHAPATCENVITVGAAQRDGAKASYSSFGDAVDIMAPGGEPNDGVITTEDAGARTPLGDSSFGRRYGTSIATPHVSATVAMMLAVNPLMQVDAITTALKANSNAFPSDCVGCGAGLLNIAQSVAAAAVAPSSGALTDSQKTGGGGAIWSILALALFRCRRASFTKLLH